MKKTYSVLYIIILVCVIMSSLVSCNGPALTQIDEINESTATPIVNKQTGNYPKPTQDENGNYPKPTHSYTPILPQGTFGEVPELSVTVDNKNIKTYCTIVDGKPVELDICNQNALQNPTDVSPNCKISISSSKILDNFTVILLDYNYNLTNQVKDGILIAPQQPGVALYLAMVSLNGQSASYIFAINVT